MEITSKRFNAFGLTTNVSFLRIIVCYKDKQLADGIYLHILEHRGAPVHMITQTQMAQNTQSDRRARKKPEWIQYYDAYC